MESESHSNFYKYTFADGEFNSYYFSTIADVIYEVKFVPSADFFATYPDLAADVFEMIISVADNPAVGRLPADSLVAPTIFAIFEDFFLPKRHVIVFICDSSDGRERARYRKFGLWFYNKTVSTDDLAKFDRIAIDGDSVIYLSLIMSRRHPQLSQIVDIFMQLGEEGK